MGDRAVDAFAGVGEADLFQNRTKIDSIDAICDQARGALSPRFSGSDRNFSHYVEAVKSMGPGADLTIMIYVASQESAEGQSTAFDEGLKQLYSAIEKQLKLGTVHEYKRLICFDRDVRRITN